MPKTELLDAAGNVIPTDTCQCGRPKPVSKQHCCVGCRTGWANHSDACNIRCATLEHRSVAASVCRAAQMPQDSQVWSVEMEGTTTWDRRKERLRESGERDRKSGAGRKIFASQTVPAPLRSRVQERVMSANVYKWATFSDDRRYRYSLGREWGGGEKTFVVIGLNPSTADETEDDPTIRRCIAFAKTFGCDRLLMLNLFALRSTDPKGLHQVLDPIGPGNNAVLATANEGGHNVIVAAWGVHGTYLNRDRDVRRIFRGHLHHLGLTKDGHPRHPLYLRADSPLSGWNP